MVCRERSCNLANFASVLQLVLSVCVCVCVCVLVCSCREDLVMAARIHKVAGELGLTKTKLLVAGIGLTEYGLVPLVLHGM